MNHPLDRPIWNALTTRQSALALTVGRICRFDPSFAPFAASADGSPESLERLVDLVAPGGQAVLQQEHEIAPPPGLVLVRQAETVQMIAEHAEASPAPFDYDVLSDTDAPEMLELVRLTQPGPFAELTHQLGRFVGVRHDGRLVAMAGERMKPTGFAEVSGVCTHPDHRGHGYAAGLMSEVMRAIQARGETPFLHAFASNTGAIALYERLGFVIRWRPVLMVLGRT